MYESRNKRKREVRRGKRSRTPLLRDGMLHVEEEHPKSWRSTRNFPALVTPLRVTQRQNNQNPTWQTTAAWEHDRGALSSGARLLRTTLLFRARYSYLHAIRQDVQSGSRYTLPWKASKHEIEPSRRLKVHTRTPLPKDPQIFIKYTRFRFSDLERCGIFDV